MGLQTYTSRSIWAPSSSNLRSIRPFGVPAPARAPESESASPAGKPLPKPLRRKMERAFGHSLSDVRVHENDGPRRLNATAYTRGRQIHFARGEFQPGSLAGQKLIGHELTHVLQQRAGRVAAPPGEGAPVNADRGLEAEADTLGARAAQGVPVNVTGTSSGPQPKAAAGGSGGSPGGGVVQCGGGGSKSERPKKKPPAYDIVEALRRRNMGRAQAEAVRQRGATASATSNAATLGQGAALTGERYYRNVLSNYSGSAIRDGLGTAGSRVSHATFRANTAGTLGRGLGPLSAGATAVGQYQTSQATTSGGRAASAALAGARSFVTPPLVSVPDALSGGHLGSGADRLIDRGVVAAESALTRPLSAQQKKDIETLMATSSA